MKIKTLSNDCKLVDLETTDTVGTCTLTNIEDKLRINVTPHLNGRRYKKIQIILLTQRPYYVYKDANIVEIHDIKQVIQDTLKEYHDMLQNESIQKVKIYMNTDKRVTMKEDRTLKLEYDEYLRLNRQLLQLKKGGNFNIEKYNEYMQRLEEIKTHLKHNHLL